MFARYKRRVIVEPRKKSFYVKRRGSREDQYCMVTLSLQGSLRAAALGSSGSLLKPVLGALTVSDSLRLISAAPLAEVISLESHESKDIMDMVSLSKRRPSALYC